MKISRLRIVLLGELLLIGLLVFFGWHHFFPPKAEFYDMPEKLSPNRAVRVVKRPPEIQKAFDVIMNVLREAKEKSFGKTCELRFYHADEKLVRDEFPRDFVFPSGSVCNSLQLFRYNDDHTVTPLGERYLLPPHIFCFPDNYFYDEKKYLSYESLSFGTEHPSKGEVVVVDPKAHPALPFEDRVIYYLDSQIFQDGGWDLRGNYSLDRQIPGAGSGTSLPVRP